MWKFLLLLTCWNAKGGEITLKPSLNPSIYASLKLPSAFNPLQQFCSKESSYVVHLSFDDGPKIPETEIILDVLKHYDIKATFLISTSNFEFLLRKSSPKEYTDGERKKLALVERMKKEGHIIGSHSFEHIQHGDAHKYTDEEVKKNLDKNQSVLNLLGVSGNVPFRFPYGGGWFRDPDPKNDQRVKQVMDAVIQRGYKPFHWDIDTWDWSKVKRKALPQSVLNQICTHSGGVILNHDVQPFTARNIENLIRSIQLSGHQFLSLPELEAALGTRKYPLYSFSRSVVGINYCRAPISDLDQIWNDCTELSTKRYSVPSGGTR